MPIISGTIIMIIRHDDSRVPGGGAWCLCPILISLMAVYILQGASGWVPFGVLDFGTIIMLLVLIGTLRWGNHFKKYQLYIIGAALTTPVLLLMDEVGD